MCTQSKCERFYLKVFLMFVFTSEIDSVFHPLMDNNHKKTYIPNTKLDSPTTTDLLQAIKLSHIRLILSWKSFPPRIAR